MRETANDTSMAGVNLGLAFVNNRQSPMPATYQPPTFDLSLVIPTRNEAENIEPLVLRLERALPHAKIELIFVDDSDDETPAEIEQVRTQARSVIQLVAREVGQRTGGLGGAVVAGLRLARAPWVGVMDADLQHPPELLSQMLDTAAGGQVDMVLASRYRAQGSASGLNQLRATVSQASTLAAKILFPRALHNVTDPMSGFFLVRRAAIDVELLQPRGFKILLEILVRAPHLRVTEVPFHFGTRNAGESKASLREGIRYGSHLWRLRVDHKAAHFMKFLLVGLSGLLVNSLVLAATTDIFHIYYLISILVATQSSTLWNFLLTEFWVFADRKETQGRVTRLFSFFVMNNAALALRGPLVYALTDVLGVYYLVSNLASLIALTVLRYTVADGLIWKSSQQRRAQGVMYNYSIHDIITVVSDVGLPELERFMVTEAISAPTIKVQIGNVKAAKKADKGNTSVRKIDYDDGLGQLGFGIHVTLGDTIEIVATKLLSWSPHVLYTNVVEPILRWTFVDRGYTLVHGACISYGDNAYLVTARTDTGKTTTILRVLSKQRRASDMAAFLSDDLTLLSPDGRVMTYPKPLTISHHTVRAINAAMLTWSERLGLLVQSRIHSRSGRLFAMLIAKSHLPVATVNTLTQLIVPPPKYHVERLVPRARTAKEGKLAGMFIIERGGEGEVRLSEQEALEVLMTNCDDAYGFPPYHSIKNVLYEANGKDLPAIERAIVAEALHNHPTVLVRSTKMDWSDRLPRLMNAPGRSRDVIEEHAPQLLDAAFVAAD